MSIIIVGVGQAEFDGTVTFFFNALIFFNCCMNVIIKYSGNFIWQAHTRGNSKKKVLLNFSSAKSVNMSQYLAF